MREKNINKINETDTHLVEQGFKHSKAKRNFDLKIYTYSFFKDYYLLCACFVIYANKLRLVVFSFFFFIFLFIFSLYNFLLTVRDSIK